MVLTRSSARNAHEDAPTRPGHDVIGAKSTQAGDAGTNAKETRGEEVKEEDETAEGVFSKLLLGVPDDVLGLIMGRLDPKSLV